MGDGRVNRALEQGRARTHEIKERVPELKERVPELTARGAEELRHRGTELRPARLGDGAALRQARRLLGALRLRPGRCARRC